MLKWSKWNTLRFVTVCVKIGRFDQTKKPGKRPLSAKLCELVYESARLALPLEVTISSLPHHVNLKISYVASTSRSGFSNSLGAGECAMGSTTVSRVSHSLARHSSSLSPTTAEWHKDKKHAAELRLSPPFTTICTRNLHARPISSPTPTSRRTQTWQ